MNRLGIFQGAFPAGLHLQDCLRLAKQCGFTGFELSLETGLPLLPEAFTDSTEAILAIERSVGLDTPRPGGVRFESGDEVLAEIKNAADAAEIRIISISTMQLFHYPLSSPVPTVRERAIEIVRKMISAMTYLGGDLVLVAPGMVNSGVTYQEAWDNTHSALEELLPYATEMQVVLGLENIWNKFLLSPREFVTFIDSFNSPWIGAYFDVANILAYGYPDHWIEHLGKRLKRVHFKDYRLAVGGVAGFTNLLQGDVPWPRVTSALHKINYDGWVVAEVTPYQYYPEQAIIDTISALEVILADHQHDKDVPTRTQFSTQGETHEAHK
jgi:L-ribulose-5-phosphate 3-epimerase